MTDKRKKNGRKAGGCQAISLSGDYCKRQGVVREATTRTGEDEPYIFLRVRVCGKCWEGEN